MQDNFILHKQQKHFFEYKLVENSLLTSFSSCHKFSIRFISLDVRQDQPQNLRNLTILGPVQGSAQDGLSVVALMYEAPQSLYMYNIRISMESFKMPVFDFFFSLPRVLQLPSQESY